MNEQSVQKLGELLALYAELEGMKLENNLRMQFYASPAYRETEFQEKARQIRQMMMDENTHKPQ